jgi:cytochrome c-type biogenesis protein CcmH/NrfF
VLVIAHAGHILIDAPLFLGPVVLLALALWVSTRRERRRQGDGPRPQA